MILLLWLLLMQGSLCFPRDEEKGLGGDERAGLRSSRGRGSAAKVGGHKRKVRVLRESHLLAGPAWCLCPQMLVPGFRLKGFVFLRVKAQEDTKKSSQQRK